MRFELTVALKYLIPRWRQLSVSIISLLSVLVISLVVWLVVLFLSVTDGIEKKWISELVALNAPLRVVPTDAYFNSYYYKIDNLSLDSDYTTKTIGEKLTAYQSDPYDPMVDVELPSDFPIADRRADGSLKDPVKEGWEVITSLNHLGVRPQEHEVSFGNLRLNLIRKQSPFDEVKQTFLNQVSYVSSNDEKNSRLQQMVLPITKQDYNNLLQSFTSDDNPAQFFDYVEVTKLAVSDNNFTLAPPLYPTQGSLKGIGVVQSGKVQKIIFPSKSQDLEELGSEINDQGYETVAMEVEFFKGKMAAKSTSLCTISDSVMLQLNKGTLFEAALIRAEPPERVQFKIEGAVQGLPISGSVRYDHLEIHEAHLKSSQEEALCVSSSEEGGCIIPSGRILGDGILISKQYKSNDVRVGDRGYLAYYTSTASSLQEQQIPVYVAGFYDPGMMPVGNKLIFVDSDVTALLRGNMTITDKMLGNSINVWLDDIYKAEEVKQQLTAALKAKEIDKYWEVQSYHDYEFARPILQQLESDKTLFTLIAIIILIVACSNIISMLVLLIKDKKREIGIMQSMGASPKRIATIFGICGFTTGLASSILGTIAAILTLHHLKSLVAFLSFLQGHEAFQAAFYGNQLPNELSYGALLFVTLATLFISFLAGIIPAVKAAKIRPSEILRAQ
ncbi:MAG: FtsX-like permease family protein [Chlamydiales bacterium]